MTAEVAIPALRIFLFGQPHLEEHGQPLKFSAPPKTLPLLAYLILHPGPGLTRDSVAFTIWQDDTEEDARANLRRHLYHLQRALPQGDGQAWIVTQGDTLEWNTNSGAWIDVLQFKKLIKSPETVSTAVELYGGDLLANYYDDWVFADREQLRNEYINALHTLVIDHRGRRAWPAAVRYARAILAADPWREDVVRQLMSAQYESGDRAGALHTYADFSSRLRTEMAVDPMPETAALHELIVRNAPVGDVAPVQATEEARRARSLPSLPFVGRQPELEQLQALWKRAARGAMSLAFIEGEAGIGKSRLAAELAVRVEGEGGRVLWGPTSFPESSPYQGLAEALHQALPLLSALKIDASALSAVASLVPELSTRRPGLPRLVAAEPEDERRRLFGGIAEVLEALARSRPLLLIIEDMHWAGDATISALRHLGTTLGRAPMLIVTTSREEEVSRAHALRLLQRDLLSQGTAVRVNPGRLQSEDVSKIVDEFTSLAARPDLARQLLARSEGNCLFLAQMIGDMLETQPSADVADSSPATREGSASLPRGLRDVIESRLSRLSEPARSLAEVCAVIGQGFNAELAAEVSGWSKDQVFDGFNELLDRRLIRELPKRGSFEYAFTHHLISDAIYDDIPGDARVSRHRRTGRVLADLPEARHGERAAEIARHFDIGGERDSAAMYYVRAAHHALSLYADSEALAIVRRVLDLVTGDREKVEALLLMEAIHSRQGARAEQQCDLDNLEAHSAALHDDDVSAEILSRRIARERALGNRKQEAQFIDRFKHFAHASGNGKWIARARLAAALHAMHTGQIDAARSEGRQSLLGLREAGDRENEVECLCLLADVETQIGALDEAETMLQQAQQVAEAGAHPSLIGRAYLAISRGAIMQHQFARCVNACEAAMKLFTSVGDREGEADAHARMASVLGRLQRYEEARRSNGAAAAMYESMGKDEGRAGQLITGASIDARLGLLEAAHQKLAAANAIFEKLGELRGLTVCALNLSFACLVLGDLNRAEAHARKALEFAHRLGHKAFTAQALANLGAVERDQGRLDLAVALMQEGLALQESLSRPADQVNDLADLALAYLMKEDFLAARQTADRMLAAAEESTDAAFWPQVLFWTGARVYQACGKRKRAAELLDAARQYALKVASGLQDKAALDHYNRLPVNRQIFAAYDRGQWPADPKLRAGKTS